MMWRDGNYVDKDGSRKAKSEAKQHHFYEIAANAGRVDAQYDLATMYRDGYVGEDGKKVQNYSKSN